MEQFNSYSSLIGLSLILFEVFVFIPLASNVASKVCPGRMAPNSFTLKAANLIFAVITGVMLTTFIAHNIDPFAYGTWYSFALMVLCVEVWFTEDPELFNGSRFRGYPIYLFHLPGENESRAMIPMASYTRIFAAWHAGGVCLCFFMHVLGSNFPEPQKAQTALALGLLWGIWASINQWRSIYGAAQFCQISILFHSLTGPGCGLCAYWMLFFWYTHQQSLTGGECVLIGTVVAFVCCAVGWLILTNDRKEAVSDKDGKHKTS